MKIVLIVAGGCLQQVLGEHPGELEVTVVDYDGQGELANSAPVPQSDGSWETADVWPAIAEPLPERWRAWLDGGPAGAA
ncbi:MAG: hypothetical protein JNM60_11265 [Candidatus Competibacteraceae bacterium]|nr:hypothetical protein [Candidatus Competibacteraceae bacterium]